MTKLPAKRFIFPIVLTMLLASSFSVLHARSDTLNLPLPVNNTTLLGAGSVELYDTYLSPLRYSGTSFRLLNERTKQMHWFDNR
ncbi:MAG: DUF3316 domain-containing protein, partial [Prevotella sp.]|nr:DUF3316 domain-containing protein [Prevotella sp.]